MFDENILIKQLIIHEGIILHVYKDSLGIDTIGIGRNLKDRGISKFELSILNKTIEKVYEQGITEKDAHFLLKNDIDIVEKELWN